MPKVLNARLLCIAPNRKGKCDARATEGIFLGYDRGNVYRIFIPATKKIIVSQDVRFNEATSSENANKEYQKEMIIIDMPDVDEHSLVDNNESIDVQDLSDDDFHSAEEDMPRGGT